MGCVTFELIKKVWNIMLASQAYMKDRSVLQIHNSSWVQSKFKVAFEFFEVGISYIFFSFYNTMVLFLCLCLNLAPKSKVGKQRKLEIKFKKMYEKGKMALNENKLSKKTTCNFTICTFFCYIGN